MNATELESLVQLSLDAARRLGAEEADALVKQGDSLSVSVRKGEIESVERARSVGLGLRVLVEGRQAAASTTDLDPDRLRAFSERLVALAIALPADPVAGLPDADAFGPTDELSSFDEDVAGLEPAALEDVALRCEQAAFDHDPRIENSEGGRAGFARGETVFANSHGVVRRRRGTRLGVSCSVVARDPESGSMESDYWWASRRFAADLPAPESIGAEAGRRVIRRLGATSPATAEVPVVLSPEAAGQLIGAVASALNGYSVYRKTSFLAGRIGDSIAAECFSLVDEPHRERAPGSRAFDGEGLATRPAALIRDGVLERYIVDTYAARKLGVEPGHQATRGLGSPPRAGATSLHVRGPATPLAELYSDVEHGVWITGLMGHGINPVTGDFSRGAVGVLIEKGELTRPLREITVAGNLLTLLSDVEALGDDADPFRSTSTPSLRIRRLTVAGAGSAS